MTGQWDPLRRCLALLSACALGTAAAFSAAAGAAAQSRADPEAATGLGVSAVATAERQMVVTANPHATEASLAVLREGGSAADATVAALFVLGVVEPQSSGLGGGAFALVHGPGGLVSLDGRETAPAGAGEDLFFVGGDRLGWLEASETGRAVGVPSLLRLMEALHERHGRLPWARLVEPAIALARNGFAVSPRLAGLTEAGAERLARTEAGRVFLSGGLPLRAGRMLRQQALATTLSRIAEGGVKAFYAGEMAAEIVQAVGRAPVPGALSLEDLSTYRVVERPAVCHPYRQVWRVCGMGPPSSGATTVGQILMIFERLIPDMDAAEAAEAEIWHAFAEASRLAYADRAAYLGDPDHVEVPVAGLLDPAYLSRRALLVAGTVASHGEAQRGLPPGAAPRTEGAARTSAGTTHLSVVDKDGLAISLTASIETAFGSGRMARGVLLNNQLTDFDFSARNAKGELRANAPGAGKRPRSSMAPTIVYRAGEDRPHILIGSPGGSRIPEYVAGALIGLLDLGLDPAEAAALFHVSHRNRGAIALEEAVLPQELAERLSRFGHVVEVAPMTSGLHIIRLADGVIEGGADPRREGRAAGD